MVKTMAKTNRVSPEKVKVYGPILLRNIRIHLNGSQFFTREDLLQIPFFTHVSTIYRYAMICAVVRHLINTKQIIEQNRTDLCLPNKAKEYIKQPLHEQYFSTITKIIVNKIGKGKEVVVMDIVTNWTTDPHLTTNNKRVAVRGSIHKLVKDGVLVKKDTFEYITQIMETIT
jgi:hypothetical protein